jgi:hypothetical protein
MRRQIIPYQQAQQVQLSNYFNAEQPHPQHLPQKVQTTTNRKTAAANQRISNANEQSSQPVDSIQSFKQQFMLPRLPPREN